jgi:Tfp pilus assembly protein PilV
MFAGQLSFSRINSGFSLLEVLLALFVSLLMITLLTHHYLQRYHFIIHDNVRTQNEMSALQIYQLLQDEIMRAGQIGCAHLSTEFKVKPYQRFVLTNENALVVTADSLHVRYQALPVSRLKQWFNSRHFSMTKDIAVAKGEILLISDCLHAEIFTVLSVEQVGDAVSIYTSDPLQFEYTETAEIGRFASHLYALKQHENQTCLVRENQHGHQEYLNCEVSGLQFRSDKKGVEYEYQIADQRWSGYATPG